jgi:CO/xanthine dehydrogenase FAD-binding subunit
MHNYVRPTLLSQALSVLASGPRVVLAGGTDYYPARVGQPIDDPILDITDLTLLRGITDAGDHLRLGALTTWTDLLEADLPSWLDGLKAAAREVGGVQIQNAGTLAGNLCNASPAADGVPNLLACDARVELSAADGVRQLPVAEFLLGSRRTARAPHELVTALLLPKPARPAHSCFLKLGARRYLVISIVMVAVVVEIDGGRIGALRVAVGSCSAVARRLVELERELVGRSAGPSLAGAVEARHLAALTPIDDIRGSAGYRTDAALTLVRRAIAEVVR